MADGWWFAAYTLPHEQAGGIVARAAQLPVQDWSFEENDDRGRGTLKLALPRDHPDFDIDSIFAVDPDAHANDVGSSILVYNKRFVDGDGNPVPVGSFFLSRRPDTTENPQEAIVELTGRHPITALDFVAVYPFDYPANPSRNRDWKYGAPSILTNGGFEDGNPQSEQWAVWFTNTTTGTWTLVVDGEESNPLDWDATTAEIKDAIEQGMGNIISVSVTGAGEEDNPWIITVTDPSGEDFPDATANTTGIDGQIHVQTVRQGGGLDINGWTRSVNLAHQSSEHGRYASDGFRLTRNGEPVRTGDYALRVNGLSLYAGVMQVVRVVPGQKYRASIWVYTANTDDYFRLVIRDRFEEFIASSHGLSGTNVPANTWTEFTCEFTPEVSEIVFRFAFVGKGSPGTPGNPSPYYVDDATLSPGEAPANMGVIWNALMDDVQVDHSTDPRGSFLTWINRTWDETNDSAGNPWEIDHSVTLREGQTYLQLAEQFFVEYGYKFDIRLDPTDMEFYMDIFQEDSAGTDYSNDDSVSLVIGKDIVSGEIVKSEATATDIFARGSAGLFAEVGDAALRTAWERRERFLAETNVNTTSDLNSLGTSMLGQLADAMLGMKFEMMERDDGDVWPFVNFRVWDRVNVEPGSDSGIGKAARQVKSLKVDGHGGSSTQITVHLSSEVFGSSGFAAMSEGVRRLLRRFRFNEEPVQEQGIALGIGGGGMAHILIVSDSEPAEVQAKADFVVPSVNSAGPFQAAVDSIEAGTIWVAGIIDLEEDVTVTGLKWVRGLGYNLDEPPPVSV